MNEEIKLEYMHLCDYASPALLGKINLMGIFESIFSPKAPDFFVAVKISAKAKTEYKVSFEIQSEKDNTKIFVDENPIIIPNNNNEPNFTFIKLMKNIDFKDFGSYRILIIINGLQVGYKEIKVQKLPVNTGK